MAHQRGKVGKGKGRSCLGKTAFSRSEAQEAAWYRSKKYLYPWNAYPCRFCSSWHIGHSSHQRPGLDRTRRR